MTLILSLLLTLAAFFSLFLIALMLELQNNVETEPYGLQPILTLMMGTRWLILASAAIFCLLRGDFAWISPDWSTQWTAVLGVHSLVGAASLWTFLTGAERQALPALKALALAMGLIAFFVVVYAFLILNPEFRPAGVTATALHQAAMVLLLLPAIGGAMSVGAAGVRSVRNFVAERRAGPPVPKLALPPGTGQPGVLTEDSPVVDWIDMIWESGRQDDRPAIIAAISRRHSLLAELTDLLESPNRNLRSSGFSFIELMKRPASRVLEPGIRKGLLRTAFEMEQTLKAGRHGDYFTYEVLLWRALRAVQNMPEDMDFRPELEKIMAFLREFDDRKGKTELTRSMDSYLSVADRRYH